MSQEKKKVEDFVEAYKEFCKEWGYRIVAVGSPTFAPTNHGTFEIGLKIEYRVAEESSS